MNRANCHSIPNRSQCIVLHQIGYWILLGTSGTLLSPSLFQECGGPPNPSSLDIQPHCPSIHSDNSLCFTVPFTSFLQHYRYHRQQKDWIPSGCYQRYSPKCIPTDIQMFSSAITILLWATNYSKYLVSGQCCGQWTASWVFMGLQSFPMLRAIIHPTSKLFPFRTMSHTLLHDHQMCFWWPTYSPPCLMNTLYA